MEEFKKEKLEEFDDKVNILQRLIPSRHKDEISDFGYKTKEGNTIYTIPDFGNIRKFLSQSIESAFQAGYKELLTELEEKLPKEKEFPEGDAIYELSERDRGKMEGFNSCLKQIRSIINKLTPI